MARHEFNNIENYHTRSLKAMKPGETIYAQRVKSGMMYTFFGTLVSVERNIVTIKGRWVDPNSYHPDRPEEVQRFAVQKCYLWGRRPGDDWSHCHWFKRASEPVDMSGSPLKTPKLVRKFECATRVSSYDESGACVACGGHTPKMHVFELRHLVLTLCAGCCNDLGNRLHAVRV